MQGNCKNIYRTARIVAGFTQEKAAEMLGISVRSLADYETGVRLPPNDVVNDMVMCYANTILKNLVASAYVALTTAAPTAASTGSGLSEPSGGGYARVPLNTTNGNFSAANRVLTNDAYIYFPEATASWGTITHVCFVTAASGGSLRYFGALNSAVAVAANTVPLFKPATINISLDAD